MKPVDLKLLAIIAILILAGCTSGVTNPVSPAETSPEFSLPGLRNEPQQSNRKLLGIWTIVFDTKALQSEVIPDRELNTHYNVTSLIPTPQIRINYYDPITGVMDSDITITNPSGMDAYDVRGIILPSVTYQILFNADHWTPLYDLNGGNPINPFKAYAKSQPRRKFAAHKSYSENFQLYMPDGITNIKLAVDASYPSNCEEPYSISGFSHGTLKNFTGATTIADVFVDDWQYNVSNVYLHCPEIVGQIPAAFHHLESNMWELELVNNEGARSGEYTGWIIAKSSNSPNIALYHMVTLTISHALPSNPHLVGKIFFYDSCTDVVVNGGYAYFADGSNGLKIFNISNPYEPELVSCLFQEKGYSQKILLKDNLVIITDFDNGLAVIDVTIKQYPIVIGRLSLTLFRVNDIALSGNFIYMALGSQGISTIEISDPQHPRLLSVTPVRDEAMCVTILGNYAYVADDHSGITVFDISVPSTPTRVGFMDTPGSARDIAISNSTAYIADHNAGLTIADITNRKQPIIIRTISIPDYPYIVDIYGGHAYVGTITGLTVLSLSNPTNPQVVGEIEFDDYPQKIAFSSSLAYVATALDGMNILNISNPSSPQLIASTGHHIEGLSLDISNDIACTTGSDGLKIIDVSNPREPEITSTLPLNGNIDVDGSYVYVGITSYAGYQLRAYFKVVNISDPYNPVVIYTSPQHLDYLSTSVKVVNGFLYVVYNGYGDSFMEIFNIQKPDAPVLLSDLFLPLGGGAGPEISDDFLYIGSAYGITVVDISSLENPRIVNTFDYEAWMLAKCGNNIITANNKTLRIFDISNPASPQYISQITILESIMDIKAVDSIIYVLAENWGLKTVSIDNPSEPILFSAVYLSRENVKVAVQDNHAYITKASIGFCSIQLW